MLVRACKNQEKSRTQARAGRDETEGYRIHDCGHGVCCSVKDQSAVTI